MVWSASYDPFGRATVQSDPDGNGQTVMLNLRFPGQYFDQETGLHYNYFRDYDPATGRYLTSDRIGLEGGLNTYAYVGQNPTRHVDLTGEAWQLPVLFCLRFPRICKEIIECGRNPLACKAKFCSAGNAIYKWLCNNVSCRVGDSCTVLNFKQQGADGCVAGRIAVTTFCYGGKSDPNHQRELSDALRKAADCEKLRSYKNCPGCE